MRNIVKTLIERDENAEKKAAEKIEEVKELGFSEEKYFLKIDLEKCYPRISRSFVEQYLKKFQITA